MRHNSPTFREKSMKTYRMENSGPEVEADRAQGVWANVGIHTTACGTNLRVTFKQITEL